MKKLTAIILILAFLFCGCAGIKTTVCDHPEIKTYINVLLKIAQVGYPVVMQLANSSADPNVLGKINQVDAGLSTLGSLTYDVICPSLAELDKAEKALEQVQQAKVEIGALK